jgi:hypothetical protein
MNWVSEDVKAHALDLEHNADHAFALKEMDKLLKDIGVEVRRRLELAESVVGVTWMQGSDAEPVRTEHCTATVNLKMQPSVPKRGTPEYAAFMKWLGYGEGPHLDAIRLHWPTICDIVTKNVEEGKPLPPGITPETLHNPKATLTFYKRKEVVE